MTRRNLIKALVGAFVAPDPERLLWTPGKKLISIPAARDAADVIWLPVGPPNGDLIIMWPQDAIRIFDL